jgi:16S rRNA (cytidine1402-2'-O)-methyltransferase
MDPGLYIIGTPIGNLEDITYRAVRTLQEIDLLLAEDTRQTGILLQRYEISKPMLSCHEFNEQSRVERVLAEIRGGRAVMDRKSLFAF